MPKKTATRTIAFFVFDSDLIAAEVSDMYGGYIHAAVLKALAAAVKPPGGWKALPRPVKGCHGDLLENSALGNIPGAQVLRSWISAKTHGMDLSDLDEDLALEWESEGFLKEIGEQFGEDLGEGLPPMFVPYLVGFDGSPGHILDGLHAEIQRRGTKGYKGRFIFTAPGDFKKMAADLGLVDDLRISGTICSGWQVSSKVVKDVGLVEGVPR